MPSLVDQYGVQADPGGEIALSDENIDRFVDIMIAKLHSRGVTIRDLARILNRPKTTVHRRYEDMGEEARDFYVALQLG